MPLNSSWYRIITADGMGYYVFLPAKFIHHDSKLDFKWMNEVYPKYYSYNSFSTPLENFMAPYEDKKINKYYPGLSFLWMPFFFLAHLLSKLFGLPADGFSVLYQVGIGLAAVIYTYIGLWYLRKLLAKLFNNDFIAALVPILIYYGTNLFSYSVYFNSFTHAYSFAFITLAFYFAHSFMNEEEGRTKNLMWFLFCFLIIVFLRPLNILFLLALPVVSQNFSLKVFSLRNFHFNKSIIGPTILCLLILIYQFGILYAQTGTFFPNTYTGEKFHFDRPPHIFDILFSYHAGWFVYVPLALISFFGFLFFKNKKTILFVLLFFSVIIYLYSSWWYWSIFSRTIVDFSSILSILLAFLFYKLINKPVLNKIVLSLAFLSVGFFQLKAYQLRNGILNSNYTYGSNYWEYFFTTEPTYTFPVPPSIIIEQKQFDEDFESENYCTEDKYAGQKSLLLDTKNPVSTEFKYKIPTFFIGGEYTKIKTSFWCKLCDTLNTMAITYTFYGVNKQEKDQYPLYINCTKMKRNTWVKMEFGISFHGDKIPTDSLGLTFTSVGAQNKAYIDKAKTQFFLTNNTLEMVP